MTTYQIKNEYTLPKATYYRTLWLIKDYPRLCSEADGIIGATPPPTETPEIQRQRDIKATENQNLRYAETMKTIRAIEDALMTAVPPDARNAVFNNVVKGKGWPLDRGARVYGRYKQSWIYHTARNLHYI